MERDLPGTLAAVAAMGYTHVEFAGYFQHKPSSVRRFLQEAGLSAPSSHLSPDALRQHPQAALDDAAEAGHEYVVLAWWDRALVDPEACGELIELLNRIGRLAGERGLSFAYHNHDFEFANYGDQVPYDRLLQETSAGLVEFELDVYWALTAGRDPLQLINSQPKRFPLLHAKDRDASGAETDIGRGQIDFTALMEHLPGDAVKYVFVERDEPADPMASAAMGLSNLRKCMGR